MQEDNLHSSLLLPMDDDVNNVDLYCHESPLVSSAAGSSTGDGQQVQDQDQGLHDLQVEEYMARQRCFAASKGYLDHLMLSASVPDGVSTARSRGVHYIIYAFGRLGLTAATAFNAVNYLDRFLSINCHLRWETWMVELVSVACLSIASKLDEVNVPSLHHLQMEEVMSHSFRPATIRDMELTLLKALQWRLACVTPFSFLQIFLPLTTCITPAAAASRCTRLLIRSLSESSLLWFDPSVIASSALHCVALEIQNHHKADATCHIHRILRPECPLDKGEDECFDMMKALYASLDRRWHETFSDQQRSPISVTPIETDGTVNRSTVSRRLFGTSIPQVGTEDEVTILPDTQGMK